ncbi:unnamed protein product, partial [Staurois parvus]
STAGCTGGWHWWGSTGGWAQVGGTGGHRWVALVGGHRWVALLGTCRWHCRVAQVGALLGTAGHRWGHCWAQVGALLGTGWAGLVGALLGGTCGCHCWAPIIRAL